MATVALSSHRSRSVLTILGIIVGITAIMLVMTIGESVEQFIIGEMEMFGPSFAFIAPGRQPEGFAQGAAAILIDSLRVKDYEDLRKKENVPDLFAITPLAYGPARASHESETYHTTIIGTTPSVLSMLNIAVIEGTVFTEDDINRRSSNVLIGTTIAEELFGQNDAVGQTIKIKGRTFRVMGVMEPEAPVATFDIRKIIIMPYSSAHTYLFGTKHFNEIWVEARTEKAVPGMVKDIEALLRNNHSIDNPSKDDFYVITQEETIEMIGTITTVLTVLLSSVAAISLVVGGVGIMNIMFVSVTERTKEIGLRKALGARNKDILMQFLIEAVILTLVGGIIGIALGVFFGFLATFGLNQAYNLGFEFAFPYIGAFMGVLVSTVVGFGFGIFPARDAAKKSPIEALRYE